MGLSTPLRRCAMARVRETPELFEMRTSQWGKKLDDNLGNYLRLWVEKI